MDKICEKIGTVVSYVKVNSVNVNWRNMILFLAVNGRLLNYISSYIINANRVRLVGGGI